VGVLVKCPSPINVEYLFGGGGGGFVGLVSGGAVTLGARQPLDAVQDVQFM
jgi:hypothetical protein